MSRNTWTVHTLESGDVWTLGTSIYVPNNAEGLTIQEVSTQTKTQLIDGSNSFIRPEVKYLSQPLQFEWDQISQTFMEKIRDYQRNNDILKITTHVSGRYFVGSFIDVVPIWLTNQEDLYDLNAVFEIMPAYDI